jgi:large subunit ribosomal protein L29
MKASDLREKSGEDLRELAKTLQRDVFQNRLKNFTNRLDDTSAIRKAKRDYARVVTVLRQKQGDAPAPKAEKAEKAAPKAEVASAATAEAKPKKTATKKSSAKADKKAEAK